MSDRITSDDARFSRRVYHEILDMIAWWKRTHAHGGATNLDPLQRQLDVIKLANDTSDAWTKGWVVEINEPVLITAETTYEPWFYGRKPILMPRFGTRDATKQIKSAVGVLLTGCPAKTASHNPIVFAQCSGICQAIVSLDATAGLYHRRARPVKDSYILESAFAGPMEIVSTPGATGTQICTVRVYTPNTIAYWAKTPSSGIPAGTYTASSVTPGWADCEIWEWEPDNERYEPSGVFASIGNNAPESVAGDKFIRASSDEDWRLIVDIDFCVDGLDYYY